MTTHTKTATLVLALGAGAGAGAGADVRRAPPRGRSRRSRITIIRDDWGIAHVHGKTDADAVFGMIYAQAEDDFNRVETNFINSMGRLAEAEGETEIYRDLRMKLFIDPDSMKAQYAASPAWLQALMNAWADGLNYYLHTHPEVKPRVITRFEPWMALTFSEGSIGGDIEKREPRRSSRRSTAAAATPAGRGRRRTTTATVPGADRLERHRDRAVEHARTTTRCC